MNAHDHGSGATTATVEKNSMFTPRRRASSRQASFRNTGGER